MIRYEVKREQTGGHLCILPSYTNMTKVMMKNVVHVADNLDPFQE
jgi:hypothetical protein